MKRLAAALALLALVDCSRPPSAGQQDTAAASAKTDQAAQSAQPAQATQIRPASDEAPPMENGVYVKRETCPGEGGCPWVHWRANKTIELHAREDSNAPIVATLKPGEWVVALGGETRLVPMRGIVQRNAQGLKAGDVVYQLGEAGEGFVDLLVRGQIKSWFSSDDEDAIAWGGGAPASSSPAAPAQPPAASTLGWWVHVKRETDGATGWISKPDGFECMGPIAGDEGCRG